MQQLPWIDPKPTTDQGHHTRIGTMTVLSAETIVARTSSWPVHAAGYLSAGKLLHAITVTELFTITRHRHLYWPTSTGISGPDNAEPISPFHPVGCPVPIPGIQESQGSTGPLWTEQENFQVGRRLAVPARCRPCRRQATGLCVAVQDLLSALPATAGITCCPTS